MSCEPEDSPRPANSGALTAALGLLIAFASFVVWLLVGLPTPAIGVIAIGLGVASLRRAARARVGGSPLALGAMGLGLMNLIFCVSAWSGYDLLTDPFEQKSTFTYVGV